MDFFNILLFTFYTLLNSNVSGYVVVSNDTIKVKGYIYHPQEYNSYEVEPLPPHIEEQLYVQKGDYVLGHYTLTNTQGSTIVDYAGDPVHGFHAVVSGAELHAGLATLLASSLKFKIPKNNTKDIPLPSYKVPVLPANQMKLVKEHGDKKKYWVPAEKHNLAEGHKPVNFHNEV